MFKKNTLFFGLGLLISLLFSTAHAQSFNFASLSALDFDHFPRVSAFLDVRDAQGFFVSGLDPSSVTVIEDQEEFFASELVETRPGAQLVLAFNSGNSYAIRDGQGFSRFEYLSAILQEWMNEVSSENIDDLSLITPGGAPISHTMDVSQLIAGWQSYVPNLESDVPGLDVLSRALDLVADPTPQTGMGRAIFFVTPSLPAEMTAGLRDLTDRANQSNIRIYVLMIDSSEVFTTEPGIQLQTLTAQTGGQFFAYSGTEPTPDFDYWFESARRIYQLSYQSQAGNAGMHTLAVRVAAPQGEILSESLTFDLQLRPPNPAFVSVPAQIVRSIPEDADIAIENLEPRQFTLEVIFDFPDTIQREITYSALYANDELVAENLIAPYNLFSLDLTAFEASERVFIRVEAVDELGLVGSSLEIPVEITVQRPEQGVMAVLSRNTSLLAVSVVTLAGAVLLLVLVLAGRLRPRPLGEWRKSRKANEDPVTQPLGEVLKEEAPSPSRLAKFARRLPVSRIPLSSRKRETEALAFLEPISDEGELSKGNGDVLKITSNEVTFGSDPGEATLTLDDPAIDALHARLWMNGEGGFFLADSDSVAGTWINYAPVSQSGSQLEHGDLLHIGKCGFRFQINQPKKIRKAVIIPQEDSE